MKPVKIKHLSKGSKTGNTLLTRVRLDRSDLNLHKYSIGLSDSPECICHAKQESSFHFIMDCFPYKSERQTLYSLVKQYIPNVNKFNKGEKIWSNGNRYKHWKILIMNIQIQILPLQYKILFSRQKGFLNKIEPIPFPLPPSPSTVYIGQCIFLKPSILL